MIYIASLCCHGLGSISIFFLNMKEHIVDEEPCREIPWEWSQMSQCILEMTTLISKNNHTLISHVLHDFNPMSSLSSAFRPPLITFKCFLARKLIIEYSLQLPYWSEILQRKQEVTTTTTTKEQLGGKNRGCQTKEEVKKMKTINKKIYDWGWKI